VGDDAVVVRDHALPRVRRGSQVGVLEGVLAPILEHAESSIVLGKPSSNRPGRTPPSTQKRPPARHDGRGGGVPIAVRLLQTRGLRSRIGANPGFTGTDTFH
jgi:hypothetical protein